jgi:hypothetical protein
MLLPILEDRSATRGEAIIKTISTRIAGGRREVSKEPAQVRLILSSLSMAEACPGNRRHARVSVNLAVSSARG